MKRILTGMVMAASLVTSLTANAAEYVIDKKGAHAFIQFKIQHLGYSWLYGRFNDFDGEFTYDSAKPNDSKIKVNIDVTSLDSNHAERDKHLRGTDFLDTGKYPSATFVSTKFNDKGDGKATLTGDLTLHGVTRSIDIDVSKIGEGKDPWGGYRAGFTGTTTLKLTDFGIPDVLGPASGSVEMILDVEGIRK
ncbi:YceI family protein [Echinimonas agarilytica]|uniref:YceI family protein n=1 Tax=Echinimonas agarilytica TaxID=1215918 RepID=A0AA42B889_9GAMM|nr:YceI family protein [Echinimonas agarilytica]MCM2680051.1 YceI family protein [Echinimonas agarilytica]